MLSFTGGLKVFIALEPCDLRKSFNGLHALVSEHLGEDPRQGGLFVFTNRRKTRLKILYWDGTGLWVLIKRLEEGSFAWPKSVDPAAVKLRLAPEALAMLTDGNNRVENAIRPTAIGKKNWLFVGDADTGQRGAILYTLIESCRRRGIDPHAYLRDVLTRLPSMTNWQIKDITPEAWARSLRAAAVA